jgi:hypothetical protein
MNKVIDWLHDPFGRRKLRDTHEVIIQALEQAATDTHRISHDMKRGRYPIGSIARRRDIRQREVYHA